MIMFEFQSDDFYSSEMGEGWGYRGVMGERLQEGWIVDSSNGKGEVVMRLRYVWECN